MRGRRCAQPAYAHQHAKTAAGAYPAPDEGLGAPQIHQMRHNLRHAHPTLSSRAQRVLASRAEHVRACAGGCSPQKFSIPRVPHDVANHQGREANDSVVGSGACASSTSTHIGAVPSLRTLCARNAFAFGPRAMTHSSERAPGRLGCEHVPHETRWSSRHAALGSSAPPSLLASREPAARAGR